MRTQWWILVVALFLPQISKAQLFEGIEGQFGMELPLQVGARGKFLFTDQFYLLVGGGYAPGFLMDTMGAMSSGLGAVGRNTGDLIADSLADSFYFDLRGGWNLQGRQGFFVEVGYSMLSGGGGSTSLETVEGALDTDYNLFDDEELSVKASTHNLTAHAGYNWIFASSWLLVAEIGMVKPVVATTTFSTNSDNQNRNREDMKKEVEEYLDDAFKSQLAIFTAGVYVSYNF